MYVQSVWVIKIMKILITIRHPGPAQAILSVLTDICDIFDKVIVIASGIAKVLLLDYIRSHICNIQILIYNGSGFEKTTSIQMHEVAGDDSIEYETENDPGFIALIDDIKSILKKEEPDVLLRTTPAILYGIDEALSQAAFLLHQSDRLRCYQDDYACGMLLDKIECPIATIDEMAKKILKEKGLNSIIVGRLDIFQYQNMTPYKIARKVARKKLGIGKSEQVYLYCTVCTGNIEVELKHFASFLANMNGKKVYIKFHPRNTLSEKKRYLECMQDNCVVVENVSKEEIMAFSDYVISPASAINIDVLLYQIYSNALRVDTISVYTYGDLTTEILKKTLGISEHPLQKMRRGCVFVNENNYSDITCRGEVINRFKYFKEASLMFYNSREDCKARFINYLLGIQEER